MKKKLMFIWSLLFALPINAAITNAPVPGGIKVLPLSSKKTPTVYYHGKRVAIKQTDSGYQAVIGISLEAKEQNQLVTQTKPTAKRYHFSLNKKAYRIQRLTIKNKRKVTPHEKDQARIDFEEKDLIKTLAHWQNDNPFIQNYIAPVKGPITSTFGLKRVYNGIPKAPHTALDIAAKSGTPVVAVADGQVINLHHRFFTGNTIIIDHGQGVMSLYAHLSAFKVKNGETVKQGQVIGLVGKTGRVTGAHLHWGMFLNQTAVDPLLFVIRKDIQA